MRLLLATRNSHKLKEVRRILSGTRDFDLIGLDQLGIAVDPAEDDIEVYDTFRENAIAKARYFATRSALPTIADDSGLVVDALDGAPGVRSKRFAEDAGYETDADASGADVDRANNELLLERLYDVPDAERTAHYVCAVAVVGVQPEPLVLIGTCSGRIAQEPRGGAGFGYDPLFFVPELDRTFGESSAAEKNERSHRARAFRALGGHAR